MVPAYALLLASTVAPAELDAAGLARALATQNGGQAVVALADGRTVSIDESGTAEMVSAELKKRGVRLFPGAVTIAHLEFLPDAAMQSVTRLRKPDPVRQSRKVSLPAEALKGGRITFVSEPGTTIDLQMLPKLGWSLPLVLSPAFSDTLAAQDLAVSVKDVDEADFLRSVAKAIGGRYRTDGKALYIEASGGELRARALRGIELASRNPRNGGQNAMDLSSAQEEGEPTEAPVTRPARVQDRRQRNAVPSTPATLKAQFDLARAVTNAVSAQDFERYMNGEADSVTLNLAGLSSVQNALVGLLRSNATTPPEVTRVNRMLATVPSRQPGVIVLGSGYTIDATLNIAAGRGGSLRTMRLKVL